MAKLITEFIETDLKLITEGAEGQDKQYYITGVFMQAETKNRNNRIYPMEIVKREVEKYNEDFIKQDRAYSELGHPECFLEQTQVLTTKGFKSIKDIQTGELVFTRNLETDEIEINSVLEKIDQKYTGTMYKVKGKNIDTTVTPNHRFLIKGREGKSLFLDAKQMHDNPFKNKYYAICKTGQKWNITNSETIQIPAIEEAKKYKRTEEQTHPLEIDSKIFMRFMGYYLSEGSITRGKSNKAHRIIISQKDPEVIKDLENLFKQLSDQGLKISKTITKNGCHLFVITDWRLHSYLKSIGNKYTKYIPEDLKNRSTEDLFELFDAFVNGDGRIKSIKNRQGLNWKDVFSVSEKLIDDLAEVFLKLGYCPNKWTRIQKDRKIQGRLIEAKNSKPLHFLGLNFAKGIYLDPRFLNVTPIQFSGKVYCIKVKNENFFVNDNNQGFWSGNSPTINLERVSHLIKELRIEGKDVVGKALVLDTPYGKIAKTLLMAGGKLGVSTRGLGSLKENSDGTKIVQDDFSLAAIDIVADPSAPKAFVEGIQEGIEWTCENGVYKPVEIEEYKKQIQQVKKKEIEKKALKSFSIFMNTLKK